MFGARTPSISPISLCEKSLKCPNQYLKLPLPFVDAYPPNNITTRHVLPCIRSSLSLDLDKSLTSLTPTQTRVDILAEYLPYFQRFRGKTIVVKYGGFSMKSPSLRASVISDLVLLSCVRIRPIFVHGGGHEINNWLDRIGVKPNFLNGLRVTDACTMEIVTMVLVGKVNKHLVLLINKAGATAVVLSGIDGRLLTARPSPKAVELGFVGDVALVGPTVFTPLVENNHIPVNASVAADEKGQSYNINADTMKGELAAALGAEKLIILTDVAGILEDKDDPSSFVKEIDINGVRKMVSQGKIAGGMIPKVQLLH